MFHLVLESHDGRAPGADSEEKHEPVSDIDTVVVDSLKALDPERPIREAVISRSIRSLRVGRQYKIECFCGPQVKDKLDLGRILNR